MELNVGKTKIIIFRKGGGRNTKEEFLWNGEEVEQVKEFTYLGYSLRKNNRDDIQTKKLAGKERALLGMVWSIGERKFRSNWKKIMRLFYALIQSVMMYGMEIWGWCERPEIE